MLQSAILEPILVQMLAPAEPVTSLTPYSVALVSRASQRPLLTFTAKPDLKPLPEQQSLQLDTPPPQLSMQQQIEELQQISFEDDYIGTDKCPDLAVAALSAVRAWVQSQSANSDHTTIYSCGEPEQQHIDQSVMDDSSEWLLHIRAVDDHYGVMVVAQQDYPAAVIDARLKNLCEGIKQVI